MQDPVILAILGYTNARLSLPLPRLFPGMLLVTAFARRTTRETLRSLSTWAVVPAGPPDPILGAVVPKPLKQFFFLLNSHL